MMPVIIIIIESQNGVLGRVIAEKLKDPNFCGRLVGL